MVFLPQAPTSTTGWRQCAGWWPSHDPRSQVRAFCSRKQRVASDAGRDLRQDIRSFLTRGDARRGKSAQDRLRRLGVLAGACGQLGTSVITLCTGTRDPEDMWRSHPENDVPEAWQDLLASMERALEIAEEYEVTLAFEPEVNNVVASAEKGRRLLDDMQSSRLKVVMDAANLFREGELPHAEEVLDEAFELLGEDVVIAHAKDVKNTGEVVAAGRGELDYDRYLENLRGFGFEGPLILHNLEEGEVEGSVAFLRTKLGVNATYSEQRGR